MVSTKTWSFLSRDLKWATTTFFIDIIIALQVSDWFLTFYGLTKGIAEEGMPIGAKLIERYGLFNGLIILKGSAILFLFFLRDYFLKYTSPHSRVIIYAATFVIVCYILAVTSWMFVILRWANVV